MAQLPNQETAEYYNWLFKIEAQEFEKELLEIVSSNSYLMRKYNLGYSPFLFFQLCIINSEITMIAGFQAYILYAG